MKQIFTYLFIVLTLITYGQKPDTKEFTNKLSQGIRFTENKGQVADMNGKLRPDILFTAHSSGVKLFITANGIYYQFSRQFEKKKLQNEKDKLPSKFDVPEIDSTQFYRLDMKLIGAGKPTQIIKEGEGSDYDNFYLAHCPNGILGVKNYNSITFKNIYPNIDWIVYSKDGIMEYDFLVHPGADINAIKLKYDGAVNMKLEEDGSLKVTTPLGTVQEHAPLSLQNNTTIKSSFIIKDNTVGFEVKDWDGDSELRIDPSIVWATYYGGFSDDVGNACETDASGNIYLGGYTSSTNNIASGGFQNTFGGALDDAFLVKFNSGGTRLWGTYYGGSGADEGYACAKDTSGNIYLGGYTSSTNNIASGGFQNTFGGGGDAFLAKFNSGGARLWGTYYGGSNFDYCQACATDASGNVYLGGDTYSTNNIASGGFQNTIGGGADAYLVKFNSAGARLWGTYYGGSDNDGSRACAIDVSGNVYLGGQTYSTNNIASGGFQNTIGGGSDAFLVKFNSGGTRLWGTYYGGSSDEYDNACATDASGNVYLSGQTYSTNNIATGGFQNTIGGSADAFLVKFSSGGARLWGTYYGGSNFDYGQACATDASSNIYLGGYTESTNNIASGGFQNTYGALGDAFLVKFNSAGARLWGTYYGGSNFDNNQACATDASGNVYLAGQTFSTNNIASGGFQNTIGGGGDAFLAKISDPLQTCNKPTNLLTSNITSTSVKLGWSAVTGAVGYQYEIRKKGTTAWSTAQTANNTKTVTGLLANTTYQWRVIAACRITPDTLTSPNYATGPEFTTLTFTAVSNNELINIQNGTFKITPNPTTGNATLTLSNNNERVTIKVTDASGKVIWQTNSADNNVTIPSQKFASGVYVVSVVSGSGVETVKLVRE